MARATAKSSKKSASKSKPEARKVTKAAKPATKATKTSKGTTKPTQPAKATRSAGPAKPVDAQPAKATKPVDAQPAKATKPVDAQPAKASKPADAQPAKASKSDDAAPAKASKPAAAKSGAAKSSGAAKPANTSESAASASPSKPDDAAPAATTEPEASEKPSRKSAKTSKAGSDAAKPAASEKPSGKSAKTSKPDDAAKPTEVSPKQLERLLAHAKQILGADLDDETEERPDGKGGWETWLEGKPFAGFELGDGCVWARLLAPRNMALSPEVTWERDRRDGWVRTALPPTYKPEPWLVANIGALVGQTRWELRHGTEQTITAQLGPYVVVPDHLVGTWHPKTRVGSVDDLASIADLPHGQILVMGKLGALTWHPDEHGGVLARVFAGKAEAPQVRAMLAGASGWKAIGTIDVKQPQLWAFDGATPGTKITALQALQLGLTPARYAVATATQASEKATLLLVRLRR